MPRLNAHHQKDGRWEKTDLDRQDNDAAYPSPHGYSQNRTHYCRQSQEQCSRFRTILKNVNLPSVHFRALRHIFASTCIQLGFDVEPLSELLEN